MLDTAAIYNFGQDIAQKYLALLQRLKTWVFKSVELTGNAGYIVLDNWNLLEYASCKYERNGRPFTRLNWTEITLIVYNRFVSSRCLSMKFLPFKKQCRLHRDRYVKLYKMHVYMLRFLCCCPCATQVPFIVLPLLPRQRSQERKPIRVAECSFLRQSLKYKAIYIIIISG